MMNVQLREEKLFKARLASVIVSCNNFFSYWFIVPPVKPLLVYFFCFSVPEVWILFTSNPLTLLRASFFGRFAHFLTSCWGVFFSGKIVAVNKLMPVPSVCPRNWQAATTGAKRRGFVWSFSRLIETFRGAEVQVFNAGGGLKKLLPAIVTDYGDGSLPSLALASGRAI
jgi:hypothetical protein